jgi:hypothetical protein
MTSSEIEKVILKFTPKKAIYCLPNKAYTKSRETDTHTRETR